MPLTEQILRNPGNGHSTPVTDSRVIKIATRLVRTLEHVGYPFDAYDPLSYEGLFIWKLPNMTCIRYANSPEYWFQITENEVVLMKKNEGATWGTAFAIKHFAVIDPDTFDYTNAVVEWVMVSQ